MGTLVAGVTAVTVAAVAAAVWHPWSISTQTAVAMPHETAVVERTSLTANLVLSAQLEYGSVSTLVGGTGTITRLPHAGDSVATGQPLYEVDGVPVLSFHGDRPLWRAVESGMSDGPDVQEVEQNLADLGFGDNVTIDNTFTAATARSISAWQKSIGRERTGRIDLGDVVMVTSATVRVNTVTALVGGSATGSVLTYTDPGLHGRITVSPDQLRQLAPGMAVSVRLPGGSETPATVGEIDPGGAPTADPAKPTVASVRIDFTDDSVVQGIGLPALRVTVGASRADNALVVPVTALIALRERGYAVEVETSDGQLRTVPVDLGLIADSRVQVTGGALLEGDHVVVAG